MSSLNFSIVINGMGRFVFSNINCNDRYVGHITQDKYTIAIIKNYDYFPEIIPIANGTHNEGCVGIVMENKIREIIEKHYSEYITFKDDTSIF